MLKKLMVLVLTGIISIAYLEAYAEMSNAEQVRAAEKVGNNPVNIKLAMNDVIQIQQTMDKRIANKQAETDESDNQLSKIPAQAWLILTALFCFVMRSSRRVV